MTLQLNFWPTLAAAYVVVLWFVFGAAFFLRKKPPVAQEAKMGSHSWLGVLLQGIGLALVLIFPRAPFTPVVPMPKFAEIILTLLTLAISTASVWITLAAVHTLGKQFAFKPRLVEGHKLIVSGPYRIVRHPIYTGLLGKILATGLAFSEWQAIAPALLVFAIGVAIRIRREEKLLRDAFGDDFGAYARYVPAVFPRLF